jgi:hypothetical protein
MKILDRMFKDEEELYHESMQNAYLIITRQVTFLELFEYNGCSLPFNPKKRIPNKIYDDLIDYYIDSEEYEKCARIKSHKEKDKMVKIC